MKSELALLEKRIEDVVEAVKAVRAKVDKALQEPAKRWRTKHSREYVYIDSAGNISTAIDHYDNFGDFRYEIGNYFQCLADAQEYINNLTTKQKLKDLALELNNGKEIDWSDMKQTKFFIVLNCTKDYLEQNYTYRICDVGQIHCLDRQFLNKAKQRIGEQELINLIKSGV